MKEITADELLICPFCGGVPQLSENANYAVVLCTECGCKSDSIYSYTEEGRRSIAINKWNRRVHK